MSHYEQRLQNDLDAIRTDITALGSTVHQALSNALDSLLNRDSDKAYQVILGDHPINRAADRLNVACHGFIAKHLPSAGHLRFVSSSLRTIILLERLGDYAATIAKESVRLVNDLEGSFRSDVQVMGYDALGMLAEAISAYETMDADLAIATKSTATKVDREFIAAYSDLVVANNDGLQRIDLFARLNIINLLERINDQAKNLCEEVVFTKTGKTKKRRRLSLYFLDSHDDSLTQVAVALCRKFYADRVEAFSAGKSASASIKREYAEFCAQKGLDFSGLDPSTFSDEDLQFKNADVVVCINAKIDQFSSQLAYGTSVVHWTIAESDSVDQSFIQLSEAVASLIDLIRGPSTNAESV